MREKTRGVWELRVSVGMDSRTGKYAQKSRIFRGSKSQAQDELAAFRTDVARGQVPQGKATTLGNLIDEWMTLAERDLSPTTYRSYVGYINNWIKPSLGTIRLDTLTARHLDGLYRKMGASGKAPSTIHQVHAIISRVLHQAEKWDLVVQNVARKASPPTTRQKQVSAPSNDVVRSLIREADRRNPDLAALLALAAITGARRGELCGLRWSDIDFRSKSMVLQRSVISLGMGGGIGMKGLKAGPGRQIALDDLGIGVLKLHLERVKKRLKNSAKVAEISGDSFVFSRRLDGSSPYHPDWVTKFFTSVRDSVGADARLHDLRHFAATELISAGVDIRTVAGRLGHSDPGLTLRVYSHVIQARDQEAAALLGSKVLGAG